MLTDEERSAERKWFPKLSGEDSPTAKLTEQDVIKIRAMKGNRTAVSIAAIYKVSPATISNILNRVSWT